MKRLVIAASFLIAAIGMAACDSSSPVAPDTSIVRTFTVTLAVPPGSSTPLAPGVFVIHASGRPIFARGIPDRGEGLEALAEDGDPAGLAAVGTVFNTPVGDAMPGPATPGKSYRFSFTASPGHRLSFATMYVQSNDGFFAPSDRGLELYNGSTPVTGDVTSRIMLWDAGTEVNQEPGMGPDQAPRQAGPDTGAAEAVGVDLISNRDNFTYDNALEVMIDVQ